MTASDRTVLIQRTRALWRRYATDQQVLLEDTCHLLGLLVAEGEWSAGDILDVAVAGGREGWPTQLLAVCVQAARDRGMSWREVGEAFGVSRQAAHQRFVPADGADRTAALSGSAAKDPWVWWQAPDAGQVPIRIYELALRSLSFGQRAYAVRLLQLVDDDERVGPTARQLLARLDGKQTSVRGGAEGDPR